MIKLQKIRLIAVTIAICSVFSTTAFASTVNTENKNSTATTQTQSKTVSYNLSDTSNRNKYSSYSIFDVTVAANLAKDANGLYYITQGYVYGGSASLNNSWNYNEFTSYLSESETIYKTSMSASITVKTSYKDSSGIYVMNDYPNYYTFKLDQNTGELSLVNQKNGMYFYKVK